MATIKAVLKPDKKKDGTYPIAIRITKDRKTDYIPIGYSATPEQWDKDRGCVRKNYPNSTRLNNLILKRVAEYSGKAIELETDAPTVTATSIKQSTQKKSWAMFNEQAGSYLTGLKEAGKYNQYTAERPRVRHFQEFLKKDIALKEIDVATLEKFKTFVRITLELSERSAVNHLSMISSVFAHAKKSNLVKAEHSPFGKGKITIKFPESAKIGLNAVEIQKLETVTLSPKASHCRNLFLFSFYLAGMRVSDVLRLKWRDFQDGRLIYVMGKNEKAGTLKVPEKALKILARYEPDRKSSNDFVFPELKGADEKDRFTFEQKISYQSTIIDKCLKKDVARAAGIEKTLSMHIARHSFATEAGDKISIQMLQKLYRHSSVTTTVGYQSAFKYKDADDALDAVLSSIEDKTKIQ
jgi:integrase/recombinase XerD